MSPEKLEHDSKVLHRFIQFYCDKEHAQMPKKSRHWLLFLLKILYVNCLIVCAMNVVPYCNMPTIGLKHVLKIQNQVVESAKRLVMKDPCGKRWQRSCDTVVYV